MSCKNTSFPGCYLQTLWANLAHAPAVATADPCDEKDEEGLRMEEEPVRPALWHCSTAPSGFVGGLVPVEPHGSPLTFPNLV